MRIEVLEAYLDHSHNYVNPQLRGPALIAIDSTLLGIATIFLALRLYTRAVITRSWRWDDLLVGLGYVCMVGLIVVLILANQKYYWDRHIWDIPIFGENILEHIGQVVIATRFFYITATVFTRLGILGFYNRLFSEAGYEGFQVLTYLVMAFNVGLLIIFGCLSIWLCGQVIPVSNYWSFTGHCLNEGQVVLVSGITSCVTDFLTTILPIALVLELNLPLVQRISVIVLLSLGFLVTIAGIIRTYYGWQAFSASADETWWAFPLWLAASIEVQISVICACVPPTGAFFARIIPSLGTRFTRPGGPSTDSSPNSSNVSGPPRRKQSLLSSSRKTENDSQIDVERTEPDFSPHPLSGQGSNRKAAEVLGDDRVLSIGGNRTPLYIMAERSVEVTRSRAIHRPGSIPYYYNIDES